MVGLDIELSTDPLKAQSCNDLTILNKVLLYLIFDRDFFVWGFFMTISPMYGLLQSDDCSVREATPAKHYTSYVNRFLW